MRQIATTRPSLCGCCRRPVYLLETVRSVTLIEITRLSSYQGQAVEVQTPHQCPEEAVVRWDRLAAMARMARRAKPQQSSPDRETKPTTRER